MSKENESDILKQFSLLALRSLSDLSASYTAEMGRAKCRM